MRPLKWRVLAWALVAAGAVGAGGSFLALRGGAAPVKLPWSTLVIGIALGAVALFMAWPIRQLKRGKRRRIDSTRAVRTAMLAQASAYAGALLGGLYGGFGLVLLRDWSHEPRREAAIAAGVAALGGLIMLAAGVIAEWWCRITDPGDDESAHEVRAPGVAH
ncbi:DUF3180 family protein [Demequina lutea]|uniref:DUF3180 domain-containing protein n=1 Tax=Demequina lutea TaxID=431489 RepID=A0A7Z0CGJ7_9MICO|nr:DUF3180 family protein [Demequina lutea]NYI40471.1 hypothetical protein [Demequina lutea]